MSNLLICPWCGTEDPDWYDGLPPKNDGDRWTAHCHTCEKVYIVIISIESYFTTKRGTNESSKIN